MIERNIVFSAPHGMHGMPGTKLVQLVKSLDGKVMLATEKREVNAASLLSVVSLGLKTGVALRVRAEGGDEQGNMDKVIDFLNNITE